MAGWIVYIRIVDREGELATRWAVAHQDWNKAIQIAAAALGVDRENKPADVHVITQRAERQAAPWELDGVAEGTARQVV